MAFTKINAAGIGSTELVTLHSLEVINNATVGGVLTYEDVTNVDSIGLITARNGIVVGSGITLSKDGDIFATGVTTSTTFVGALTGNVTGNISGGTVAGSTGTFSGDVNVTGGGDINISDGNGRLKIVTSIGNLGILSSTTNDNTVDLFDDDTQTRLRTVDGRFQISADHRNEVEDSEIRFIVDGTNQAAIDGNGHFLLSNDSDTYFHHPAANSLAFTTLGAERLRIESAGNIGIGTDNPNNLLHVYGGQIKAQTSIGNTSTDVDLIRAQSGSGGNALFSIRAADAADDNSDWDIKTNANEDLSFTIGGSSEKLRIKSDGNVGINQSNPTAQLQVSGGGAYVVTNSGRSAEGIDIQSSSGDVEGAFGGAISFGLGQTGRSAIAAVQNSSDEDNAGLAFFTHPSNTGAADAEEKMRLTSDGHLLIGTTSTTGISASGDDIIIGSIGDSTARGLTFATTATGSIRWADAGDNAMGRIQYDNSTDVMAFMTSNATRIKLDSDGLKFGSDTAAANALDDYEEGTWTPAFKAQNNSNNADTQVLDARYTKIGRHVTVIAYIKLTAHASGTTGGVAYITGFPFTNVSEHSPLSVGYWANWAANQMFVTGTVQPSETYAVIRHNTSTAAATQNMDYDNNLQPNSGLIFSVTYQTSQ